MKLSVESNSMSLEDKCVNDAEGYESALFSLRRKRAFDSAERERTDIFERNTHIGYARTIGDYHAAYSNEPDAVSVVVEKLAVSGGPKYVRDALRVYKYSLHMAKVELLKEYLPNATQNLISCSELIKLDFDGFEIACTSGEFIFNMSSAALRQFARKFKKERGIETFSQQNVIDKFAPQTSVVLTEEFPPDGSPDDGLVDLIIRLSPENYAKVVAKSESEFLAPAVWARELIKTAVNAK